MGFGWSENILSDNARGFETLPLGRVRALEVLDELLANIREPVLRRHTNE